MVWEAVLPGALSLVWLVGREDCWNELATPWPGGSAERVSRRGVKWPTGRVCAGGRTGWVLSYKETSV